MLTIIPCFPKIFLDSQVYDQFISSKVQSFSQSNGILTGFQGTFIEKILTIYQEQFRSDVGIQYK
jgi:hypothetical protein